MKRVRFHDSAESELREAALFYNAERPGWDEQWLTTLESVVQKIQRNPATGRPIGSRTRRCQVPVFPYAVIFQNRISEIYIVAIAHLRRRPGYWIDRLENSEP